MPPSPIRLLAPSTALNRILRTSSPLHLARPSSTFQQSPSPPRLPADQQAEFERLQRAAADRLADPTPLPHEQPTPTPPATSSPRHASSPSSSSSSAPPATSGGGGAGVWRGARPEFDGDTNPKTGEVGGPKTEPLRWGSGGDWSYNGRVTDF